MACIILHNFLTLRREDNSWLASMIQDEGQDEGQVEPEAGPIIGDTTNNIKATGEAQRTALYNELWESYK